MIEVTQSLDYKTGNTFIDTVRIVEPIEYRNGVHIERVDYPTPDYLVKFMERLGFTKVDFDINYLYDIYARKGMPSWWYKLCDKSRLRYMKAVRWLYRYGSVFQPIPCGEMFSWGYFTPIYFISPYIKRYKNWIDNIGVADATQER